jgi:hypothetical protein
VLQDNAIFEGLQIWVAQGKWKDNAGKPRVLTTGELYEEVKDSYRFSGPDGAHQYSFGRKYPFESARKFGVELKNTIPELSSEFDIRMWHGRARRGHVQIQPKTAPPQADRFSAISKASGER